MKIVNAEADLELAVAVLDTGCQSGNWISQQLVQRLGKAASVSQDFESPGVLDANERPVTAAGVIDLQWKKHPRGNRFHLCRSYVFANIQQFDILLGAEYMVKENLIQISTGAIVPLVKHENKKGRMQHPCKVL